MARHLKIPGRFQPFFADLTLALLLYALIPWFAVGHSLLRALDQDAAVRYLRPAQNQGSRNPIPDLAFPCKGTKDDFENRCWTVLR